MIAVFDASARQPPVEDLMRTCLALDADHPCYRVYSKITSACGPQSGNGLVTRLASWTRAI